jgi:hypothetical protein
MMKFLKPLMRTGFPLSAKYSCDRPHLRITSVSRGLLAAFKACAQFGRVTGSPNRGKILLSKRVMAETWAPERVRTISPTV